MIRCCSVQTLKQARSRQFAMTHSNRLTSFGADEKDPIYEATVQSIEHLSPSIKQFKLKIVDPQRSFRFQSGMFLDFHLAPTITPIITGFSICNTPEDYLRTNRLELAIKRTDYPPTKYMFDRCQVNETIHVKPGGDFVYHSTLTNDDALLLICAGIGANPIVSMLRHVRDLYEKNDARSIPHRLAFFYTAARAEDLVFRPSIDTSCQQMIRDNLLRTHYFLTKEINNDIDINKRRINREDLAQACQWLEKPVTAYLCGPSSFIHWTENILRELNVNNVFYEKWW
jgi:ferredoxin-NADP reductase